MASTTFVNYQTVIDASWLNDVNSAVYNGTFQASTISPTNITVSGTTTLSGTLTGTAVSNYLASPPAIGGTAPSTGKFTSITDTGLTSTYVTYAGTGGLLSGSANMTFNGTSLTLANDASISGLTVGKGGGAVSSNTAVGASGALGVNTTGANGVAVGAYALQANTSGSQNVGIGQGALYGNTTGSDNTAVGFQPMASNTTGGQNVAIGRNALASNTTASNNTAVGYQAGYSNTTGTYGVFLGMQAGYSSNANGNTIVGWEAGYSTTGAFNTFIGYQSGINISSGAKNTILGGYNGNQGGLDIRTSSNYIVLSDGDGNPRAIYNNNGWVMGAATIAAGPGETLQIQGTTIAGADYGIFVQGNASSNPVKAMRFYSTSNTSVVGSISFTTTSTSYNTSSDYRLKENVQPMTGALATVAQLKPVTYDWIADKSKGQGFIAHELQAVVPDCVTGAKDAVDKDGNPIYQGIDTSFLVATLTAAIQEQQALIVQQAADIAALKAKVGL